MKQYSFPASERLKRKKIIESLFRDGRKAFRHPVMAVWREVENPSGVPIQVGFSVPKKHHKKAVDRNRIKRRMREAYRLQKSPLLEALSKGESQIAVLFVLVQTDNTSYEAIAPKMMLLLRDLAAEIRHAR